jgi:hypothetical protein
MTGIRSWTGEVTAFGVVVRIEQVLIHCPFGSLAIPQSCECKQVAVVDFKTVRLLHFALPLPLVESVCRNETSTGSKWIAERGYCRCCFRSRVNHSCSAGQVFRPGRNESPTHARQVPMRFLRVLSDDRDRLSRSNVVAGTPVWFIRHRVEILFDKLFPARQSIAPAHGEIIADRISETRYQSSP